MPKKVLAGLLSALAVCVISSISTGAIYAFVLPRFFPGHGWGTYSPLFWGIAIAALIDGYIGYRVAMTARLPVKISFGFCYAGVAAILVAFFSLFIILNTRGS